MDINWGGNARLELDMWDFCRPFAEASPFPTAAVAGAGNIIRFVNPAFCVLAGRPAEELLGVAFSDVLPADDEFLSLLDRVYRTGQSETYAGRRQHISALFYSCALWPILAPDGGAVGILIQVTETQHAHERGVATSQALILGALHQHELVEAVDTLNAKLQTEITQRERSEGRLSALLESASEGIVAIDEGGTIFLVNAMSEKLFGCSRVELLGQPVEILLGEDLHSIHRRHRQTYLAHPRTRTMGAGMSLAGKRKDGTTFPVEISLSFVQEGGSQVVLALIEDVTERRRVEEQVRELAKLESLGVLAAGIAHDFNNMLQAILGNASMAMDQLPAESPILEMLEEVIRSSERAAHLTNQMLAYSGKGRFLVQPVNLPKFTRNIVSIARSSIPQKIQLDLQLADEVLFIEADIAQLQQLIVNLFMNAGEAIGDAPGFVTIRTGVREITEDQIRACRIETNIGPGRYVFLEVRDTGVGMDELTRQRIFDPFFTTKFTGRGLGLSAVLGIVRGHHGAIEVESTPGLGSTFTVFFPETTLPRMPEPIRERTGSAGARMILIVDDEVAIRKMARRMLENTGYKAIEAENGEAAVRIFRENACEIAAVLLDMTMPLMSGAETLKHLRDLRPDIPIALSSGFSELEALARFPAKTVDAFLQKPYTAAQLIEKINNIVAGSMKSDRVRE